MEKKRQARIDAIEAALVNTSPMRNDAAASAFFARELENIETQTYKVEFAEFKMTQLLPVTAEAGPGAESHTYYMFEPVGVAQLIKNYATDFKKVDIKGTKYTLNFENFGDSYGYNFQEIENAKLAKRPLDRMKAETAREVIEQTIESVMAFGYPTAGISGFFNNVNITEVVFPSNSTGADTNWELKTALQIVEDISALIRAPYLATKGREKINTCVLPNRLYTHLIDTPIGTNVDKTIMMFLKNKHPGVQFTDHHFLDTFEGNTWDKIIVYSREPRKLKFHLPVRYKSLEPHWTGASYEVNNYCRMGGLQFIRPLSAAWAKVAG